MAPRMKAPFPYPGGKMRWAKRLMPHFPVELAEYPMYVEPFFGAGGIFFAKPKAKAEYINDLNGDVVNFMRVIRERPEELRDLCRHSPYARDEYFACLQEPWPEYEMPLDDVERITGLTGDKAAWLEAARRFWVLARQGYAGPNRPDAHRGSPGFANRDNAAQTAAGMTEAELNRTLGTINTPLNSDGARAGATERLTRPAARSKPPMGHHPGMVRAGDGSERHIGVSVADDTKPPQAWKHPDARGEHAQSETTERETRSADEPPMAWLSGEKVNSVAGSEPAKTDRLARNYAARSYFHDVADRLFGVSIDNRPFQVVMKRYNREKAFCYCDPPYLAETRRGNLYRYEMSDDDHRELLALCLDWKGLLAISGYDNALYNETLAGWRKVEVKVVSSLGAHSERVEVLWMNYDELFQRLDAPGNSRRRLF